MDQQKPPKKINSYNMFIKKHFETVDKNLTFSEKMKMVGEMWRAEKENK